MAPWFLLALVVLIGAGVVVMQRSYTREIRELRRQLARSHRLLRSAVGSVSLAVPTAVQAKVSTDDPAEGPRGAGVVWDDHAAAVAAHKAEVAAAVTEIRDRTAEVEAATVERVMASDEYLDYVMSTEPVRQPTDVERLQPLALEYLAVHGRERPEPLPPIQPEPVVAEVVTEVLEAVEVPEGDDEPPQDESHATRRSGDDPPQGGRAITPFGADGQPGYRFPWGSAPQMRPPGVMPLVPPRGELPADWQRPFYRAVAYLKEPIQIDRRYSVLASTVRQLRVELMAWVESWPGEPGTHRRRGYIGGHRGLA